MEAQYIVRRVIREASEGVPAIVEVELPSVIAAPWPRPIPVSERLPEDGRRVLAFYDSSSFGCDDFCVAWFTAAITSKGVWVDVDKPTQLSTEQFVTHWLPLPPKP